MAQSPAGASIALIGAHLRTNTAAHHTATALLIIDGVIALIGDDDEVRAAAPEGVRIIELNGATVTPGLWDSHIHSISGAKMTSSLDLGGISTPEELREVLAQAREKLVPGEWLAGWNLEYEMFEETGIDRSVFDEAVGDTPTLLQFYDCHTGVASIAALDAAGITGHVQYPDGSEVVVDGAGRLTGELREMTALRLVESCAPSLDLERELSQIEETFAKIAATGVTGGAIMDGTPLMRERLAQLESRGRLRQRMVVHEWHKVHFDDAEVDRIIAAKAERGRLWEGGAIKLYSDGVVDTGTALLHEPDSHGHGRDAAWPNWDRLVEVIRAYDEAGMLIATHAVGDLAVNQVLDIYADLPARAPGEARHSIEHLEVMSDIDVNKLGTSGVVASMQPLHMQWRNGDYTDNWAQRLGEHRRETGYRCRSVLESGARLVLGSDWPVAEYDPRIGMAWARGRTAPGEVGAPTFEPNEILSGEEALLAYTLWPAQARGYSDRGHISVGALGDVTVFAADPVEASVTELTSIAVLMTIVDGSVVYE